MTATIPRSRRAEGLGYWGMASSFAIAVAPALGFWVYKQGWMVLCVEMTALNLLMAIIAWRLPDDHSGALGRDAEPDDGPRPKGRIIEWRVLLLSVSLAVISFGYGGLTSFSAFFADELGITPRGLFLSGMAVSILTGRLTVGRTLDRRGHRNVLLPCLLAPPTGLLLLALAQGTNTFLISALVFGAGFGLMYPAFTAYVMEHVPTSRRGAAFGAMLAAFDTGIGTGSTTMGWLIHHTGFRRRVRCGGGDCGALAAPVPVCRAKVGATEDDSATPTAISSPRVFPHAGPGCLSRRPADAAEALPARLGWDPPGENDALADRWVAELDRHGVDRAHADRQRPGDAPAVRGGRAPSARFVGAFMLNPAAPDAAARVRSRVRRRRAHEPSCLFPAMHHVRLDDPAVDAIFAARRVIAAPCSSTAACCRSASGRSWACRAGSTSGSAIRSPWRRSRSDIPSVPVIIPHFGAGFFREALMAADMAPNILLDTSSSNSWIRYHPGLTLADVFARALDVVGPARLLFGTDRRSSRAAGSAASTTRSAKRWTGSTSMLPPRRRFSVATSREC